MTPTSSVHYLSRETPFTLDTTTSGSGQPAWISVLSPEALENRRVGKHPRVTAITTWSQPEAGGPSHSRRFSACVRTEQRTKQHETAIQQYTGWLDGYDERRPSPEACVNRCSLPPFGHSPRQSRAGAGQIRRRLCLGESPRCLMRCLFDVGR